MWTEKKSKDAEGHNTKSKKKSWSLQPLVLITDNRHIKNFLYIFPEGYAYHDVYVCVFIIQIRPYTVQPLQNCKWALAGVAQLAEALSRNWKVADAVPFCKGTESPGPGVDWRQPIHASLSHQCFSVPLPLSLKAMQICPRVKKYILKAIAFMCHLFT